MNLPDALDARDFAEDFKGVSVKALPRAVVDHDDLWLHSPHQSRRARGAARKPMVPSLEKRHCSKLVDGTGQHHFFVPSDVEQQATGRGRYATRNVTNGTNPASAKPQVVEKNGRPVRARTADLYRVNLS
jgi:hypothetical protein